jgi:hypothetical protein
MESIMPKPASSLTGPQIVESLLKDPTFAGMNFMYLLPKSMKKFKGTGIKLKETQQLCSIQGDVNEKRYIAFLLDEKDTDTQWWAIWRIKQSTVNPLIGIGQWSCYTKAIPKTKPEGKS